jgi:5'-nucleotidase
MDGCLVDSRRGKHFDTIISYFNWSLIMNKNEILVRILGLGLLALSVGCDDGGGESDSTESAKSEESEESEESEDTTDSAAASDSSDSEDDETKSESPRELTLLVTNDDGVNAVGIDVLVEELRKLPMVSVVVVAPAKNHSMAGTSTTKGPVKHEESTTKSGYPAVAIYGYPCDAIIVANKELGIEPDFVFSGPNQGVNLGISIAFSGTVGAARQAAKMGVPALALSQELPTKRTDYEASVKVAIEWFNTNRKAIEMRTLSTDTIVNINAPSCSAGTSMRGTVEVPASISFTLSHSDCASTKTDPADDVSALLNGYAALTPDL